VTAVGFVAVCVLGAWARTGLVALLDRPAFPWGTLCVNVLGSLVAGVLHARLDGALELVAITGAIGAFTTFSAFAARIAEDLRDGRHGSVAVQGAATVVGTVGAAVLGLVAGG
jgi:CrcB protein